MSKGSLFLAAEVKGKMTENCFRLFPAKGEEKDGFVLAGTQPVKRINRLHSHLTPKNYGTL